jgi:2-polyprenyl-3-methyl-5-hydroxy-6-metoxy-1,4-benzoquinol methylase
MTLGFDPCPVCGAQSWQVVHKGRVRDGRFGSVREDAVVARCGGCGVDRLAESFCTPDSHYETGAYRAKLEQNVADPKFLAEQDAFAAFSVEALGGLALQGLTVADIGAGTGAFLDRIAGLAARTIAIEPTAILRERLVARGVEAHPYAVDAARVVGPDCDLATSFQVIEHVADPIGFLREVGRLVKPGGRFVLTTPNRRDLLMELHPTVYPSFFYRIVHRWYFDEAALAACATRAGWTVERMHYVQRYPMSNTLAWLRDSRPTGRTPLPGIQPVADEFWKTYLESSGQADCLVATLRWKVAT